jgi:hypothetical protein
MPAFEGEALSSNPIPIPTKIRMSYINFNSLFWSVVIFANRRLSEGWPQLEEFEEFFFKKCVCLHAVFSLKAYYSYNAHIIDSLCSWSLKVLTLWLFSLTSLSYKGKGRFAKELCKVSK